MDRERTDIQPASVRPASAGVIARPRSLRFALGLGWLRSLEGRLVLALLLLALLRGLLYVVVVPPWEHYDEPTHFEYAALINLLGRRPLLEEADRNLRFAIARSVHIHAPWRIARMPVDTGDNPLPDIGVGQAAHPPLYYQLASVPLRLAAGASIEAQLYSMRAFSLLLYLIGLALAVVVITLALPLAPELRVAALGVLVCVPPYTRLMTAASNDVLVALVGIFLLFIAIAIVQQGWSWPSLVLVVIGFLLPFVTKRTIFVLSLVPLLAGLLVAPRCVRRWAVGGAAAVALAGFIFLLSMPAGSSYWINKTTGRIVQPSALGSYDGTRSLLVSSANPEDAAGIGQALSPLGVYTLPREELTVGVWARALNGQVQVRPPAVLGARPGEEPPPIALGREWQFIKQRVRMPRALGVVELRLLPPVGAGAVLYDGAVAVLGDYSKVDEPPTVQPDGQIAWGGVVRPNMLSNSSVEQTVPIVQLPEAVERRVQGVLPFGSIDLLFSSLGDEQFIAAAYPAGARFLFNTFWLIVDSGFSLEGIDRWALVVTSLALLALAGWLWLLVQRFQKPEHQEPIEKLTEKEQTIARQAARTAKDGPHKARLGGLCGLARAFQTASDASSQQSRMILGLCWAAAALVWGVAMVRVHLQPPWPAADYTYPIGRYAYAAMVPTVVLLVAGLGALARQQWRLWLCVGLVALFFIYDLHAISNKIWYHYVAQ